MASLRIGLIGMGFGAQVHLPALRELEGVELVAIADSGSGRARHLAPPRVRYHGSGSALLDPKAIDAVIVAAPPSAQAEIVRTALERQIAVYCEKPLGTDLRETEALAAIAADTGVPAAVGFSMRCDRGIGALIASASRGDIGSINRIAVTWTTAGGANPDRRWSWRDDPEAGGGILTEYCTHVFDYCRLIAGAEAGRIACRTFVRIGTRPDGQGGMRDAPAADEASVSVIFDNNMVADILVSNALQNAVGHRIEVQGKDGELRFRHDPPFDHDGGRVEIRRPFGQAVWRKIALSDGDRPTDSRIPAVRESLRDFFNSVRGGVPQRSADFPDALAARRMAEVADRSARIGRSIAM